MEQKNLFSCSNCGNSFNENVNFCSKCGHPIAIQKEDEHTSFITKSVVFYLVFIAYIVIYYLVSPDFITLQSELILEGTFALIILIFCFLDVRNIFKLFQIPKIPAGVYLFAFIFPIISAVIVTVSMGTINDLLFDYNIDENLYTDYYGFPNPIFWAFTFTAFVPAVFEELGFRGYLYNQLIKITSPKVTILLTAFLFALMHFSMISILWIFPFGIVLGYLRNKYNVIWLGMIVHFIHNSLVLLYDVYAYNGVLTF